MKQQGSILIFTLLMLLILSLLTMRGVENSLLIMKLNHNSLIKQHLFEQADNALQVAQAALPRVDATCLPSNPNVCYISKLLQIDPCVFIDNRQGAQYFQVTSTARHVQLAKAVVLQITVAKSTATKTACHATIKHFIHPGRQSWREIE